MRTVLEEDARWAEIGSSVDFPAGNDRQAS
jgi:hypothetical protein